jgi:medium-chain acyl-[acyl-carrier-protein] hydrolase
MTEEFILQATVPYWNVDREQLLLLRGVFEFFQEAAIKHADLFDTGAKAMVTRGESWMLNRMAAVIHRYPRYEEVVRVVTWSTGIRTCKGFRDFRLYCGDELVASASSLWLYVNLRTKSIARVPPEIAATFPSRPDDLFRPELDKLKLMPPTATAAGHAISVRYSDVDGNGHVNNVAYFDYLQSALARSGHSPRPHQLEIQFLKEILPATETVSVALEARGQDIAFGLSGPEGLFAQGSAS